MQVHTFIADSAADAVAQIRAQLGPRALVLEVRPMPRDGLARLWQKSRIEVLACVPESAAVSALPAADGSSPGLLELRQELSAIRQKVDSASPIGLRNTPEDPGKVEAAATPEPEELSWEAANAKLRGADGGWRIGSFLENSGLMPLHAERIVQQLRTTYGDRPPAAFAEELERAKGYLRACWSKGKRSGSLDVGTHVLIGVPGAGKTVCLCKWLARTVLVQNRTARVWRLDGRVANTAEILSVYAEILGIPIERFKPTEVPQSTPDLLLVDLPGVNSADRNALVHLAEQLERLPNPHIHLVLNAAYELSWLLAQVRAFASMPIGDLIFTHLDEERRWGKLWNFVLGTNYTIRLLSAGQNIPGEWFEATAEDLLSRQFSCK